MYKLGAMLKDLSPRGGLRSLYPICRHETAEALGHLIGFLGCKSGFGNGWRLYNIELNDRGFKPEHLGCKPKESFWCRHKTEAIDQLTKLIIENPGRWPTRAELLEERAKIQHNKLIAACSELAALRNRSVHVGEQIRVLDKANKWDLSHEEFAVLGTIRTKLAQELSGVLGSITSQELYVKSLK